jgi:hypothetical protein
VQILTFLVFLTAAIVAFGVIAGTLVSHSAQIMQALAGGGQFTPFEPKQSGAVIPISRAARAVRQNYGRVEARQAHSAKRPTQLAA